MQMSRFGAVRWSLALLLGFCFVQPSFAQTSRPSSQPAASDAPSSQERSGLGQDELARYIGCAVKKLGRYTYRSLFSAPTPKNKVVLKNRSFGTFRGGFQSLFRYLNLVECVGRAKGVAFRYNDWNLQSLSVLAGIPIFAPKQGKQKWSRKRNYYNPAWIQWAEQNLIPSPQTRILGVSTQSMYNAIFRRFVRVTAYTYVFLQKGNRWQLLKRVLKKSPWVVQIRMRYQLRKLLVDGYGPTSRRDATYYYHPGHAAAFWMRRSLDSTVKEVWSFFTAVLKSYDATYYAALQQGNLAAVKKQFHSIPKRVFTLTPDKADNLPSLLKNARHGDTFKLTPGVYTYKRSLEIKNLRRITIEGVGNGDVHIHLNDPYSDVFRIRNSHRIVIRKIRARHSVKNLPCKGSVVSVYRSRHVTLEKNELNGSGAIGIYASQVRNMLVRGNHIHKNSSVGLYFYRSYNVKILKNVVEKNGRALSTYSSSVQLNHNTFRSNGK
ncbi:MAG: hypothetical protein EP343_31840 [Deltaproteobacteria bacterium]|nr:MAG: hypothetical protein EP343_31840 [Deltaproteobacteria bacterium]